jgi:hypothetical protein
MLLEVATLFIVGEPERSVGHLISITSIVYVSALYPGTYEQQADKWAGKQQIYFP